MRTLARWIDSDDDSPKTFDAAGLVVFSCGHRRPTNAWVEPGNQSFDCLICGPSTVIALELIEPTEFPCVDSLASLLEAL